MEDYLIVLQRGTLDILCLYISPDITYEEGFKFITQGV